MTFLTAPWALDGARIRSALARTDSYVTSGGVEGVVGRGDLKVTALGTPGAGCNIASGGAIILNRYQGSSPSQSYTVMNVGTTTLGSSDIPAVNSSARSHLLCVTIGDPEFSQAGHPWMTTVPTGQEETFNYVRPFVVPNVPSSTKRFSQLNLNYPAYALARFDFAANTNVITPSNTVDLREMARPRVKESLFNAPSSPDDPINPVAPTFENWPDTASWSVDIPDWATTARVSGFVEGPQLTKTGRGGLRLVLIAGGQTLSSSLTNINEVGSTGRRSYNVSGQFPIPVELRNTTGTLRFQANVSTSASIGFLTTDAYVNSSATVRFEEAVI